MQLERMILSETDSTLTCKPPTKKGLKMAIVFDEYELKVISECPEVMRIVADWHDVQQNCADDMGADCNGDEIRARELRAEADRIESE